MWNITKSEKLNRGWIKGDEKFKYRKLKFIN